jgi:hypothetical protein
MEPTNERRTFSRWMLNRTVNCYLDGARTDGTGIDISQGGLFLATEEHDRPPIGSTVAIAFPTGGEEYPVFLFAAVVRHQDAPNAGVGLKWERAVTAGSRAALVDFLDRTFAIKDPFIYDKPDRIHTSRYVYSFEMLKSDSRAVPRAPEPPRPGRAPVPAPARDASRLPDVASRQSAAVERAEAPRPPGALTSMIDSRKIRASVVLSATVADGDRKIAGRLRELGAGGLLFEADTTSVISGARMTVVFAIQAIAGRVPVSCECRRFPGDEGTRTVGAIELEILKVDESASPGIFKRYLKWLHFHSMSKT